MLKNHSRGHHHHWPPRIEPRYDAWLNRLKQAGFPVVDLRTALAKVKERDGAAFERTDTHWNLNGAREAAKAIAATLHTMGYTPIAPTAYESSMTEVRLRWGDLVRFD